MKSIITLLFSVTIFFASAQQIDEELPQGKYADFTLDKVLVAQVDGLNYYNIDGTDQKYFANLSFGRNTFDLELNEASINKVVWATFGLSGHIDLIIDNSRSNSFMTVFTMSKEQGNVITAYEVQIFKASKTIIASYSESRQTDKKLLRAILASGRF